MSDLRSRYAGDEADGPGSPAADYGLRDNFDPAKYDFYNPATRKPRPLSTRQPDEQHSIADTSNQTVPSASDQYESSSPHLLSPIEELDDDSQSAYTTHRLDADSDTPLTSVENVSNHAMSRAGQSATTKLGKGVMTLEDRVDLLFSRQHLQAVLADPSLSLRFAYFLSAYRPSSAPMLAYYLGIMKALKSVAYAEAIIRGLDPVPGHHFTSEPNSVAMPWVMQDKAENALDALVKEDFPAFIAYHFVRIVDLALADRVTGKLDSVPRGAADGLAEVFVLSDPSRPDNPIVFSSDEFHRMTGFSRQEFLGHNCRLLGGSRTSPFAINRFRASQEAEREHCEVMLNYHRDGKPFINLIMCVPLRDQSGRVRYYLGAQLDITSLVNECTDLQSFKTVVEQSRDTSTRAGNENAALLSQQKAFDQLSESFSLQELERVVALQRSLQDIEPKDKSEIITSQYKAGTENPFRSLSPDFHDFIQSSQESGNTPLGFYQKYLLVRPGSLRILFTSPDLRSPEILQSPLLSSIGGSSRVRQDLGRALEAGRKVTARVEWLSASMPKSKSSWIHCTPLLGENGVVGVWMIMLVDAEDDPGMQSEQNSPTRLRQNNLQSSSNADVIPWSTEEYQDDRISISSNDRIDVMEAKLGSVPRRPRFAAPPETMDPSRSLLGPRSGPGPRIGGKLYSAPDRSMNPRGLRSDDRPPTRDAYGLPSPPQRRTAAQTDERASFDEARGVKMPIHMPGGPNDIDEDDKPVFRKTYKSLSPYGILFQE